MTADLDPPSTLVTMIERFVAVYGPAEVQRVLNMVAPPLELVPEPRRARQDVGRFSSTSNSGRLLQLFELRDLTDEQATIALVGSTGAPSHFESVRRRCSDLRRAGYIADSGRRHHNIGSKDSSIVWTLTDAGKQAVANLDETSWTK